MGSCLGKNKTTEVPTDGSEAADRSTVGVDNSVEDDQEELEGSISHIELSISHQMNQHNKTIKYVNPNTRSAIVYKSNGDVLIESDSSSYEGSEEVDDSDDSD